MKKNLIAILFFCSQQAMAQHNQQEIKKLKIIKIIMLSVNTDGGEPERHEYYYNRNGNDTAYYIGGMLISRSVYSADKTGRPVKVVRYNGEGAETETALYTYQPDGSRKVALTDKTYGMISYEWFDKTGKLVKTQSPDRAQRIYSYDAKSRLISVKTKQGPNGGTIVDLKYTYNSKGQRIKETSTGEYRWTRTYSYDSKGLLQKIVTTASDEGAETATTETYEYEFWK